MRYSAYNGLRDGFVIIVLVIVIAALIGFLSNSSKACEEANKVIQAASYCSMSPTCLLDYEATREYLEAYEVRNLCEQE